jgi:hypothetical protein
VTDPLTPSGPGGFADDVGGDGPDDLSPDGLVLGEMTTPGAGDVASTPDGPTGPAAFYTHSGTPCG